MASYPNEDWSEEDEAIYQWYGTEQVGRWRVIENADFDVAIDDLAKWQQDMILEVLQGEVPKLHGAPYFKPLHPLPEIVYQDIQIGSGMAFQFEDTTWPVLDSQIGAYSFERLRSGPARLAYGALAVVLFIAAALAAVTLVLLPLAGVLWLLSGGAACRAFSLD